MMLRVLLSSFALLATLSISRGALERDLGNNLGYFRVTDAAADQEALTRVFESKPALVIDLRSLKATSEQAAALRGLLSKTSDPRAVRLVLINAATSPALITAVSGTLPNVLTLGPLSEDFKTDIAVKIGEDDDLRAFAALKEGAPVEKLINGAREKRRYDEAQLVKDHAGAGDPTISPDPSEEPDENADATAPEENGAAAPAKKKEEPPPLVDLVLQRAVHIHRALAVLNKG